jgi:hypothetical protein
MKSNFLSINEYKVSTKNQHDASLISKYTFRLLLTEGKDYGLKVEKNCDWTLKFFGENREL